MKNILKSKEMGIFLLLVALSLIIALNNITFIRIDNIVDMMKSNTVLGIMALGMLLVILTGGIDVSVSASVAAVTAIIGKFMVSFGGNIFIVLIVACISGIVFGLINGVLIAKLKIPAIVVTLGTMSVINGVLLFITNGNLIGNLPKSFIDFGEIRFFEVQTSNGIVGLPIQVLFFIGAAILTYFILKFTLIGRGIYAIGGNKVSAERIGYKTDWINIFLYSYMGLMVGIAAVVHISIVKQVDPNAFTGFEMQVIAAVVLGGANIVGGEGSVSGVILGVLFLAFLNNGLTLMHIPVFWQKIVVGSVIIIAVSIDIIRRNQKEKYSTKVDIV